MFQTLFICIIQYRDQDNCYLKKLSISNIYLLRNDHLKFTESSISTKMHSVKYKIMTYSDVLSLCDINLHC